LLLDGLRHRDGQAPLPVDALDDDQMDTAMNGWQPAG
jgi:hypothetical protein